MPIFIGHNVYTLVIRSRFVWWFEVVGSCSNYVSSKYYLLIILKGETELNVIIPFWLKALKKMSNENQPYYQKKCLQRSNNTGLRAFVWLVDVLINPSRHLSFLTFNTSFARGTIVINIRITPCGCQHVPVLSISFRDWCSQRTGLHRNSTERKSLKSLGDVCTKVHVSRTTSFTLEQTTFVLRIDNTSLPIATVILSILCQSPSKKVKAYICTCNSYVLLIGVQLAFVCS